MIVLSKLAITEVDTPQNSLGCFDSVPYTCHEVGHTWTPSCTAAWAICFKRAFWFSFKVYAPLYLISAVMQLRKRNADRKKIFKKTILSILQSSVFLAMNGTWFLFAFCAYRAIFGKYHGVAGYVTGFVSSFLSIIIERKSRRGALSIYVFNLALETMFKMLVSRGYATPVRHGEIYVFAIANMLYLGLFRNNALPPFIQNIFGKVLGTDETGQLGEAPVESNQYKIPVVKYMMSRYQRLLNLLNNAGPNVKSCRHAGSCSGYVVTGATKFFLIGYGIQLLTQYRTLITAITQGKLSLLRNAFGKLSIPKFFCAYVALFRVTNCFLRWIFGHDHPGVFGCASGLVAGLSSVFYPSTSITMYAISKMIEILVMKAVAKNILPYIKHFDIILYSMSMAIMFHAAVFEPHNIRPGYWKFMISLSGNCFPLMFRILLDKYGTHATKLYPNFVPNLNPSLVQTEEVKRVLAIYGKWPYAL